MAVALAAGLLLALAGAARGASAPVDLRLVGGDGWQAGNDFSVSWRNVAGADVAGAYWRLVGYGIRGGAQFVPGADLTRLEHIQVPFAGEWDLLVWLRGESGWAFEFLYSSALLRLDDVPPAVSFLPGDAQALPPQLVAAVADPLSGLADGSISYRRLDQERWSELPTQIRVGAIATELAAATPELKPGTAYLFRAEASDGAGNVAATTMRADGAPMQFQAPAAAAPEPPRPTPAVGAGAAGGRPGDEARRTRLLVGLAAARGGERGRGALTIGAGERVLLRGALADAHGGGLEGRSLRVVTRPARGGEGGARVESVSTGPEGRFQLRLPPGPSRRLSVAFAGAEGLLPARRRLALRVRAAVSLGAVPRRLATGGILRLEGRVGSRGARVPRAGKLVTISYWEREARRWRPVIVTRSDRAGRFRASYRFRYVTGRARIRLRATAPAEADWPYASGSSRPVTVEVRG